MIKQRGNMHKNFYNNISYRKILFISLLLACFSVTNVQAANVTDLQQKQAELNQQIKDNREKVKETTSEIYQISDDLSVLENNISTTENKITDLETQVENNKTNIQKTEEAIASRQRDLDKQLQNQSESLRTIYETYKYSNPVRMVITSTTLSQLINQNTYMEAIENKIEGTIDEINKIKTELEENKIKLEQEKKNLETLQEQEKAYKVGLEEQKSTKDRLLENKESEKASLEEQIERAKTMQAQVEAQISSLMRTRSSGSSGGVIATDRGTSSVGFMWPADYMYISAYYGESTPFQSFHSGIDLANISGTPIYAAADGDVSTAASMGDDGYGNYLVIGHNARFASLYGHLQSFAVSEGQHVTKGQIIGYMGTTGWSTGPHLHFEIWESSDGQTYARANPSLYLP